jgi:hypothetical protein
LPAALSGAIAAGPLLLLVSGRNCRFGRRRALEDFDGERVRL